MPPLPCLRASCCVAIGVVVATSLRAQTPVATAPAGDRPTRAPISIGNYPDVAGLRFNFRDRNLERVRGMNLTIWQPHEPVTGTVTGTAHDGRR